MEYAVEVALTIDDTVYVEADSKASARRKARNLTFDELAAGVYKNGPAWLRSVRVGKAEEWEE